MKDDKNTPVDSANAYLYSSKDAFDAAYKNSLNGTYNSNGSYLTGKVVKGQLLFPEIPANQPYWILIHDSSQTFIDKGDSTGIKIHRDNTEANFFIDQYQNGTQILANIKLKPINALIKLDVSKFETTDIQRPYKVHNSGYIEVRTGEVPYFVRDKICVWTGAFQALGGEVSVETLAVCHQAGIQFSYNGDFLNDTIKIYLGQNKTEPVSILHANWKSDTIYVNSDQNTSYNYFAVMVNGKKCVWDALVVPVANQIVPAKLNKCD